MITGYLSRWEKDKYFFPQCFDKAMAFVFDPKNLSKAPGKYPIDGDNIFALLQEAHTKALSDCRFEIHDQYIDIQVLLSGLETQLYYPNDPPDKPVEDRFPTDDIAFFKTPSSYECLKLSPMQYAIYLPFELHCPMCSAGHKPERIKKVVIKIHKSCVSSW